MATSQANKSNGNTTAEKAEAAKKAADKKKAADAKKKPALKVHATRDSRWRAGRNFGREATIIPLNELSKKDIALLKADPVLVVVAVNH